MLHSDLETYSRKIVNGLGAEYNPICLRLLRDRDMLRTIIIQLQNHRTPHQFLEELADNSIKKVYLPNKSHLSVIIARRQLQKETMSYGTYKLDSIEYRVVPFTWLSLELITQWRYEEIIPLRGKEYLGYKKRQSFKITIGHRTVEGRECILPNKDRCYVWADQVPQGQRIVIDSHLYNGSAGIEWHPSLELGFDENKKPLIMLLIDSLRAFYPGNRGQRLSIRTSQGHEETKYTLDNINGLCELHRAISFPLYSLAESITISIALNGELRKSKKLAFTTAYLFSASTRERIPAGTKREWGEQNYYLFAIASEQVIFGPGIVYDKIDTHLNQFVVYRLRWEEEDLPFSLAVGQLNWDFEKSRYLYLSVKHSISQEGIHLTGQQIHRFTKEHICIWTNQQLTETPSVACYLRYANEPIKINGGFQKYGNELYYFNDEAIKDLNSLTVDRDCYGKFELLFRNEKEIFGQASIIVVPELTIKGPPSTQLLAEGKIVSCTVSSHLLNLWDMKTHQKTLSIEVPIHPNLSVQPWQDNFQIPKGILHVASKAVTFFIIFPAIGETVEISLTPFVLGLRLYQRPKGQTTYQQVNNLDYYYLKNSAIYIHTHAQKQLMISINGINVREENSNDGDYLLIENLNFLKPYCQEEQNHVRIFCEDTEISFLIFWRPLIHTMTIEDNRVTLKANGPHNTSILLTLVDLSGHILKKKRVICLGKELSGYIDFLKDLYSGESLFLTSQYQMADGTVVSSTWQQRVVRQEVERMPLDWLLKGVGFSSEMLLKETVPGYTVHQQE